jgi:hypothetical protein
MVLADADELQPDLVGQHGLGDDLAQDLCVRERLTGGIERDVAERIEP